MVSDDELKATIRRCADHAPAFQDRPRDTVAPPPDPDAMAERHALELLAGIAAGAAGGAGIKLAQTLGEGGMGVVRLGQQVALRRSVAVKTLRDASRDARSTLRLLREAWITGTLEHPNVVPIHDLGADEQGGPRLVMKRIEGVEWAALQHDAATVESRFHGRALLEWNLGIFLQVANAVAFAHDRGILHRDVKPENVMIGAFGEVYVLDWGLAVALRDDGSGLLPLAADATELAGTPAYMAPEMLGIAGAVLSERTDVYLLGAVLYEVVAGHPPHQGGSLPAMIVQIARSSPAFPADCPAELARICRRAMDPDPDARFETVVQLRLAVEGYLQHRGSMLLCAEADARLAALRRELGAGDGADREALYGHFAAARFGFQQALRGWRENAAARAGLTEAAVALIEYELVRGDPGAASTLVAELARGDPGAAPELAARVAAATRARAEEHAGLERQVRDLDPATGRRTRTALGLILGATWTVVPLLHGIPGLLDTHARWLAATVAQVVVLLVVGRWAQDTLQRTKFNRRISGTVLLVFVGQTLLLVGAGLLGLGLAPTQVLCVFLWFAITAHAAIGIDRRLAPAAVGFLVAFLVSARWPAARWWAMSTSNFVLTLNTVAVGADQEEVHAQVEQLRAWSGRRSQAARDRFEPPPG